MSKKRKNFHYHYVEKFENWQDHASATRGKKHFVVPPFALFVCLVMLAFFGMIATSFSVFVTTSNNDPNMPNFGGLVVSVHNRPQSGKQDDADVITKEDFDLASTGDNNNTGFIPGTVVYLNNNGIWNTDGAKFGAYFYNPTGNGSGTAQSDAFSTCVANSGKVAITVPTGTNVSCWGSVVFLRMNSSFTTGNTCNFENRWNQSIDLNYTHSDNCYKITNITGGGSNNDKSYGVWEDYTTIPNNTVTLSAGSTSLDRCADGGTATTTLTSGFSTTLAPHFSRLGDVAYSVKKGGSATNDARVTTSSGTTTFSATVAGTYIVDAVTTYYSNGWYHYTNSTFDGVSATKSLSVSITVTDCTISGPSTAELSHMELGETQTVTFSSSDHDDISNLVVTSEEDTKVAVSAIDSEGEVVLTALKPGTIKITGTCPNTGSKHEFNVTVDSPSLSLSAAPTLWEGESGTITATSSGSGSITPTFSWAKNNNKVTLTNANAATVTVTGAATNTQTTSSVNVTATYVVRYNNTDYSSTVSVNNTSITINPLPISLSSTAEVLESQTGTLEPDVDTSDIDNPVPVSYAWTRKSGTAVTLSTTANQAAIDYKANMLSNGNTPETSVLRLGATYTLGSNSYTKYLESTVTVNPLPLSVSGVSSSQYGSMDGTSLVEGAKGTMVAQHNTSPDPVPTNYSWSISAGESDITLAGTTSGASVASVTVQTSDYVDSDNDTATVFLTATYSGTFDGEAYTETKTVSNTVTVAQSKYHIVGLGGTADWGANAANRMKYNPNVVNADATVGAYVYTRNLTQNVPAGDEAGFKLYIDSGHYYSGNDSALTFTEANNSHVLDGHNVGTNGDRNMGITVDRSGNHIFTVNVDAADIASVSTRTMTIKFPMGDLQIKSNITDTSLTDQVITSLSGLSAGDFLTAATIRSDSTFNTYETVTMANKGFKLLSENNDWNPSLNNAITGEPITAKFVPKSKPFTISFGNANVAQGADGSAEHPYEFVYGSTVTMTATITEPSRPADIPGLAYRWSLLDGSITSAAALATGSTYNSNSLIDTGTSKSGTLTLYMRAYGTDANNVEISDNQSYSVTVHYKVLPAVSGASAVINSNRVNQRIYKTPPVLIADLLSQSNIASVSVDEGVASDFYVNLMSWAVSGGYTDSVARYLAITENSSLPNFKASVDSSSPDWSAYSSRFGVNYFRFIYSGDSSGAGADIRTVVGSVSNTPTRPLYLSDTTSESLLSEKRLMVFYYSNNSLKYQTAQKIDNSNLTLYRFEIPSYDIDTSWDGNVWIAAFNIGSDDKYALPTYTTSTGTLSFADISSFDAATAKTSVSNVQKLNASEISDSVIVVSPVAL